MVAVGAELTPEYAETLRRLTGQQKLKSAFALYWAARRLKAAALRERHPDWTEERIERKVREIFLNAGD
jgi:hypothetical protein